MSARQRTTSSRRRKWRLQWDELLLIGLGLAVLLPIGGFVCLATYRAALDACLITPLPAPYRSHSVAVHWAWWTPRWQCYLPGTRPTVVFDQNPWIPCIAPSPTKPPARLHQFADADATTMSSTHEIGMGFCED